MKHTVRRYDGSTLHYLEHGHRMLVLGRHRNSGRSVGWSGIEATYYPHPDKAIDARRRVRRLGRFSLVYRFHGGMKELLLWW